MAACWARIRGRLREEVGEVEYRTWLRQMTLAGIDGEDAVILLPTRFLRDWVNSHYGDRLRALWQAEESAVRRVEIRVAQAAAEPAMAGAEPRVPARTEPVGLAESLAVRPAERPAPEIRSDWVVPLEARFTFDTFVVGKPNEFAHACARRVAEKPASQGFNPLFLYGGVGLGKTHLMHAIAWAIREHEPVRTVAYMSAEKFMYRFIAALRSQNTMEFKETLRAVDVLMIDDLQFLIGKDNTQEEFFHTFNALVDQGKQIVVSADKSPSDLSGIEDRLRTRLGCGMVADLHATTYELRFSILQAKAAAARVEVPAKVLELLASRITANVRELEGALNRLVAHAGLFGRPVTIDSAQEVLHDVLRAHERRVSIEEIQRKVAEHYNLRLTDMVSARRARNVARPRQVAMYLAKQLTQRSLPEIGRRFGNRDHTTVMHAVSRVSELMQQDAGFAEDVTLLRKMLES
ncbi:chromosomal replication initiator protein DnaA [Siccirubricoccus deserti]|uniref:Chromosomal replication initiator protein DnaA n=1 Tax=Siccirubricoccus deserti TaxID=2013562 RepID=A0A9X0R0H8_9PROT|nr:chromosomal replication initiator protein DnaA [Siccirubricoccus deserti]MBC4017429.1 chromosomal replication initiator protein DnaA [Siccirubricoccus deserti]